MTKKATWQFIQGLLAAQIVVAEVTGKQRIDGMSDREWKLISELHCRLAELSAAKAREWEEAT